MSIPKPVQLLMAALQAENPDVIITVIEEPTAGGYYHVRVAHDVVTNLTAAFGEYDGLRVFSSTVYDRYIAIHVQHRPTTITAEQYDGGASLEGVTVIDFGPVVPLSDPLPAEPMFLTEILNKYKDGSLADENDARLMGAQTTMNELHGAMSKTGETEFRSSSTRGQALWVTIDHVAFIEQFITRTLNARYGCND